MTVLFVADIHLSAQRPDLIQAFVSFIKTTATGTRALYMLGDIFEAWIGDDYLDPALEPVVRALQQLQLQGTSLYFQHGNRDFLVGEKFAHSINAQLLNETEIIKLDTQNALIMHGDQLCTDDIDYQKFRSLVRSAGWQTEFLEKPIQQRIQIAEHLRSQSKQHSSSKAADITDVNQRQVIKSFEESNVTLLIHGHTHRPASHQYALSNQQAAERIVLGDWDKSLWFIKSDASGCQLVEQCIRVDH